MLKPPLPGLRNSSGAFDLPSIITGVIVVGILAAGVLAAIFGVIPYAQDNGAKQDLSAIRTAEGVAKAKDNRFMGHAGLLDVGYLQESSTKTTKVMADDKGACYVALAKSGTGTIFYSTSERPDPEVLTAETELGCLPVEKVDELIEEIGGAPEDEAPDSGALNLRLNAVSPLLAEAKWEPVPGAHGYKIEFRVGDGAWKVKDVRTNGDTDTSSYFNALPNQTISVRVSAKIGNNGFSEPQTASTTLPDSVLKNPSFELGKDHWVFSQGSVVSGGRTGDYAHEGQYGGFIEQLVTIPGETPILTYWGTRQADVKIHSDFPSHPGATEGIWTQYRVDMTGYTDYPARLRLWSAGKLDDIALEPMMAPDSPWNLKASSSNGNAKVTWLAPDFTGGSPITSYEVTAWKDGKAQATVRVAGEQKEGTVTGLDIGSEYTFSVKAQNAIGSSSDAALDTPVTVIPGAVANPGFELGMTHWSTNYRGALVSGGRTGNAFQFRDNATISQSVTVPRDSPVLTFWATGYPGLTVNGNYAGFRSEVTEGGWTQYKADLTAHAGRYVSIEFQGFTGLVDDVSFETK